MKIVANKYNSKNVNYYHLRGSGIIQRGAICNLTECKPKPPTTPSRPIPQSIKLTHPAPLIAIKTAPNSNKWVLNNIQHNTFNSLWVNIPKQSFTILRSNG